MDNKPYTVCSITLIIGGHNNEQVDFNVEDWQEIDKDQQILEYDQLKRE